MSKLIVEVVKVEKIEKHPNADRLSIITVKGWNCIVSLDQFKVGDLVVYCPPDSIIPDNLIEAYNLEYLKKDGRVKTVKLRQYISQGLILDLQAVETFSGRRKETLKEGLDVANMINITKYEPPAPKYQLFKPRETIYKMFLKYKNKEITFRRFIFKCIGIIKDKFKKKKNLNPLFSKYTDIENIKNHNKVFKEGDLVVVTEKIHGTNFRAGYVPRKKNKWNYLRKYQEFCYGSHNVQLVGNRGKQCWYGEDVYGKIAEKYKLAEIIPEGYLIYGEIYGKGIQDLTYGKEEPDVIFFDVKYKGKYLDFDEARKFIAVLGLPYVPIVYYGNYTSELEKEHTNGISVIDLKTVREGCVIKSVIEVNHPKIGRKILKSISPEYLLRKGGTEYK